MGERLSGKESTFIKGKRFRKSRTSLRIRGNVKAAEGQYGGGRERWERGGGGDDVDDDDDDGDDDGDGVDVVMVMIVAQVVPA